MRASLFTLAGTLPFVLGQQTLYPNATYGDALSLISNTTSLNALWAVLQQYIEIASPFAHYTNVTIVAPNNKAILDFRESQSEFAEPNNRTTLEAVLKYHLLQGQYVNPSQTTFGQTFLSPSTFTNVTGGQVVGIGSENGNMTFLSGEGQKAISVSETIYFEGGVVHVVDEVLTVPMALPATTGFLNLTSTSGAFNLTGLTTSLESTWDVTIFAPANSGFAAIASETANMTVADVTGLMKYHMLLGKALYSSNFKNQEYTTIAGGSITLDSRSDGSIYVNNARILQSDILLSNGVLHIIDNVLNPDNTTVAPTGTSSGVVAFAGGRANGTTPFTNVPIPNASSGEPPLNTTIPIPSQTPESGKKSSAISGGVIAAIVLGTVLGVAALIGGIWFCFRMRGYHFKVSRKSIIISSPRIIHERHYELPQDGGKTDKVELPATVPSIYFKHRRGDYGHSDTSTVKSDTAALLEKPPVPPAKDKVRRKKESPISPETPGMNVFELSADHDARARIEKFMRPSRH